MEIVSFHNGRYGVRRWRQLLRGYEYLDLKAITHSMHVFWWQSDDDFYMDCQSTEEIARAAVNTYEVLHLFGLSLRGTRHGLHFGLGWMT